MRRLKALLSVTGIVVALLVIIAAFSGKLFGGAKPRDLSEELRPSVSVNYGEAVPDVSEFLLRYEPDAKIVSRPNTAVPGVYPVTIDIKGSTGVSYLHVNDTVPPEATPTNLVSRAGETLKPTDFFTDIYDASPVRASFEAAPDWNAEGEQSVALLLTDEYGNEARFTAALTLTAGDAPSPSPSPSPSANASPSQETYVYEKADAALGRIITADMTDYKKVKAIHDWVRNNVSYTSSGAKDGVIDGAYNAFKLAKGDCYTFYAVSEVLLTRAGIENQAVERVGGNTHHYWSLIKLDGKWYHFDATPYKVWFDGAKFTENQAEAYTEARGNNYYTYDKSLHPTVTQ
ncbi:hypothetical protein FACS18949_05710 [Clostridia bacterium]|nr:hypothetical protein FACS18949_05710 [Clostridia bacterium]